MIEQQFLECIAALHQRSQHIASSAKRFKLAEYRALIDLGKDIVPYLLGELGLGRYSMMLAALSDITGENIVDKSLAGNLEAQTELWLMWARVNGITPIIL